MANFPHKPEKLKPAKRQSGIKAETHKIIKRKNGKQMQSLIIWLIFFLFLQTKSSFCCLFAWVRSFSRPEKLWLKIHTGSSRTVYSYWVEKARLFPNWSSFSRQMPSPYVSNSCGFFLNSVGGGGGLLLLCAL